MRSLLRRMERPYQPIIAERLRATSPHHHASVIHVRPGGVRPASQAQLAALLFDDRGAGFDPVTGIAVERRPEVTQVRAVYVSAENAIETVLGGVSHGNLLVTFDVAERTADREFQL